MLCCAGRTRRWIGREYWLVKDTVIDAGALHGEEDSMEQQGKT